MTIATTVVELFCKTFDGITTEYEPEDYADIGNLLNKIHKLPIGEMAKLVTFAKRCVILISTPLGVIQVEQAYPQDSTRVRVVGPLVFHALYPNPFDDYMTVADLYQYVGSEEHKYGSNIGKRLQKALGVMAHLSMLTPDGRPCNVAAPAGA